jgi:hypothetical protein
LEPEEGIAAVRQQLARILESPSFQGSKRCQEFLQYVVDQALVGQFTALKERVIGAEVFGRPAGYETSGDAIVRVKANEVRKRLAQYYQDTGGAEVLRIDLPAGSYIPTFTWLDAKGTAPVVLQVNDFTPSEPLAPLLSGRAMFAGQIKWRMWLTAGLGVLLVAAVGLWRLFPQQSELERFWAPIIESSEPVVVCMSVRDDYIYSARVSEALAAGARSGSHHLNFPLQSDDVVRVPNGQMSLQSLRAVLDLAMFLSRHGKQTVFRTQAEVALDEIRHGGVVLVGAFYNPWAMQLGQELRYRFELTDQGSRGICWIRDGKAPNDRKWTVDKPWPYYAQPVDYAIVSRVFDSTNGRVIVSAGGMSRFGAQAAGEFLTMPQYWKSVAMQAPRGWERMNCQIILETKMAGTTPGTPKILAMHFW